MIIYIYFNQLLWFQSQYYMYITFTVNCSKPVVKLCPRLLSFNTCDPNKQGVMSLRELLIDLSLNLMRESHRRTPTTDPFRYSPFIARGIFSSLFADLGNAISLVPS
jgi:hypothetical protein